MLKPARTWRDWPIWLLFYGWLTLWVAAALIVVWQILVWLRVGYWQPVPASSIAFVVDPFLQTDWRGIRVLIDIALELSLSIWLIVACSLLMMGGAHVERAGAAFDAKLAPKGN